LANTGPLKRMLWMLLTWKPIAVAVSAHGIITQL